MPMSPCRSNTANVSPCWSTAVRSSGARGGRQDVELILDLDDVFHRRVSPRRPSARLATRSHTHVHVEILVDHPLARKMIGRPMRGRIRRRMPGDDRPRGHLGHVAADPAADAVAHDLFHRAAREREHRRAAGHRFDHDETERLFPFDRKQERTGAPTAGRSSRRRRPRRDTESDPRRCAAARRSHQYCRYIGCTSPASFKRRPARRATAIAACAPLHGTIRPRNAR